MNENQKQYYGIVGAGILLALSNAGDMRILSEFYAGILKFNAYTEVMSKLTPLEYLDISSRLLSYSQTN